MNRTLKTVLIATLTPSFVAGGYVAYRYFKKPQIKLLDFKIEEGTDNLPRGVKRYTIGFDFDGKKIKYITTSNATGQAEYKAGIFNKYNVMIFHEKDSENLDIKLKNKAGEIIKNYKLNLNDSTNKLIELANNE